MGKYDPLAAYLRRSRRDELELSFRDMERIVGGILPKAAKEPSWWTGGGSDPQSRAWLGAGFQPQTDLKAENVRFVRLRRVGAAASPDSSD